MPFISPEALLSTRSTLLCTEQDMRKFSLSHNLNYSTLFFQLSQSYQNKLENNVDTVFPIYLLLLYIE